MNPKISIIVPVYNTAEYLEECIGSIINQTFPDIEIIIVDDGSTDNSWEILTRLVTGNSKIKVLRQNNKGQGAARNLALKNATSEYVLFVDSDDWIDKETCEKLYCKIKSSGCDLLCFNYILNYTKSQRVVCSYPEPIIWEEDQCLEALFDSKISGHACNKLYSYSLLKENDLFFTQEGVYEDVLFSIMALYYARRTQYITDGLYHYRIRKQSSSQSEDLRLVDQLKMLHRGVEFLKDKNKYEQYSKKIDRLFTISFVGIIKRAIDKKDEKLIVDNLRAWQDHTSLWSLHGYESLLLLLYKMNFKLAKFFYKYCILRAYPLIKRSIYIHT